MRTTPVVEWAWAVGRLVVVGTVALGAVAQLRESPAFGTLLGVIVFGLAYDLVLIAMLLKGRLAAAFIAGTVLDNATLLVGWWRVVRTQADQNDVTDLYLILFPLLIVGVARLGSRIGPFYTALWLAWLVWSTVVYEGRGSYELEQLPLRVLFMATAAGVTIRVVSRLEKERDRAAAAFDSLNEQHAEGHRRVEAFQSAAGGLVLEQDQPEAFQRLLESVRSLLSAEYADLVVWGSDGEADRIVQSRGTERDVNMAELRSLVGLNRIAPTDLPLHVPDAEAIVAEGCVVLPLVCRDGTTAALMVGTGQGQVLSSDDLQLLNLFGLLTRVFLENVNLYTRLSMEQETLGAIQASMVEGLLVVGPDLLVRYMNATAGRLVSQEPDAVVNQPVAKFVAACATAMGDPSAANSFSTAVERTNPLPFSFEMELTNPEVRYLHVEAFEIPAPGEPMVGFLLRDITEQRELEERRNAFVSIASHEMRTPMTSLVGFSELLLGESIPEEKRAEWVRIIHHESVRLTQILEDMLDVSRLHSRRLEIHPEPVDLSEVVNAVAQMMLLTTRDHEIVTELPETLPRVLADRDKLVQVLVNFVSNAIKYSPQGGRVTIRASDDPPQRRLIVAVIDQGIGIASEDMRKLFGTFQRIRSAETAGVRGTGLGLFIVKNLVELMGGEVWVESEVGRGSSFLFSLPLAQVPEAVD